jgi:hypothetical protein
VTAVPVQTPLWQVSPVVHALLSLHAVPSGLAGFEQRPVAGSHVPTLWHWSEAKMQTVWLDPRQAPPRQRSPCVHALPSLHVVPSAAAGFEHAPVAGLQVPATWH